MRESGKMLKEGDNVSFIDEIFPDLKGKWIILYFYPKDFTSGCTREAISFRDKYEKFKEMGVEIIGVSVDDAETHKKFKEKLNLPFNLYSDKSRTLVKKFGVENMGKARRSTFLINPERNIVSVWGRVNIDIHADEIIEKLKEVKKWE
ncbi:MAG: redoxin domain-containing protein [Euryarchaeota archaeon]|jgi:peroxiredoxin Q/BCP|nr:peroxiredoxin [Thermoplasmata archaeon]MVT13281.1 redoxin domain-containing protein [Euryarchaeota archaeon]MVT36275.1 redoxin domain-containing protein [Euryarchaeota archaeon]